MEEVALRDEFGRSGEARTAETMPRAHRRAGLTNPSPAVPGTGMYSARFRLRESGAAEFAATRRDAPIVADCCVAKVRTMRRCIALRLRSLHSAKIGSVATPSIIRIGS
jgi:hypothetical protein